MLIWFTQSEYFPFSMFKVDNGGVSKHRGEESDSVNFTDIDRMMSKINDRAEFYTRRFLDYITFNSTKYPEYTNVDFGSGNKLHFPTELVKKQVEENEVAEDINVVLARIERLTR